MIGYIKTGLMRKLLNSPKINSFPDEWKELDKQAQVWEDRLYVLRTMSYDTCKLHPYLEEIRELRKKLSRIDSQMNYILMQANPEYDQYWYGNNNNRLERQGMKLILNGWYLTRSNTVVGPLEKTNDTIHPYWIPRANFTCYQSNGLQSVSGWAEDDFDLLEQVDGTRYEEIYKALNSELGFFVASIVCGMLHVHNTKEITLEHLEETGLFAKELELEFKQKFHRLVHNSDSAKSAYELALQCWRVAYDWETRQTLQGLGGCKAKTFRELIEGKA